MGNIQLTELPSGIRILTEKLSHLESFSLGFWFNTGSRDELREQNGLSHFIEHMMFKGTKKRSAKELSDEIESLGGYLNAFTSKEHTCYYGRGLSEHLEKTFDVLSDMAQNSVFDQTEIDKEAAVILDELNDIEDTPEELIFDKFELNVFGNSSLSMPIIGNKKNLRNFRREDFLKYIDENYSNDNFIIAAVGNIEHDAIVRLAEKYLHRKFRAVKPGREKFIKLNPVDKHFRKDIQQAHVILGRTVPGYESADRNALNVLSHILGGGSSSRLFQKVREENGLTYQINTFLNSFADVSTLGIYFSTNENSVPKVFDLIRGELKNLKNIKIGSEELERAKTYLKGSMVLSLESATNRMVRLANSVIYFNRIKPIEESISEIEKVTIDKISELSDKYLSEKDLNKVILSFKNLLMHSAA